MKRIIQIKLLSILSLTTPLFISCSNDDGLYSDTDTSRTTDGKTRFSSQMENTDYEIIPVGGNNYVYVPKMASPKTVTRSTETSRTYYASVFCDEIDLVVTISWNNDGATYRLSNGYMSVLQSFRYTINGSSINIDELWLRIYGGSGAHLCDVTYNGTLTGG